MVVAEAVWNPKNCDMYVLKKDSKVAGLKPYLLSRQGDQPESSKMLQVTFRDGSKREVELWDYLSIPSPRTRQLAVVHHMLKEQHQISPADIASVDFHPGEGGLGMRSLSVLALEEDESPRTAS